MDWSEMLRRWDRPEPFVRSVVAGGIAVVLGLWVIELTAVRSVPWVVGVVLSVLGFLGLVWGIRRGLRG